MRLLACLLLFAFTGSVRAEDAQITQIRALLLPMREKQLADDNARGGRPELTVIKHLLREWIESRIIRFRQTDDPAPFVQQFNDELKTAGLVCPACGNESHLGFIGTIKLEFQQNRSILVVQTDVGIQMCGSDESAYAYQWAENHWQRFWQSERTEYVSGKYFPQFFHAVLVSRPDNDGERLVLTIGQESWCTSNWHQIYHRLWQTKSGQREPKLLVDEGMDAFVSAPIKGRVSQNEALVEYAVSSIDGGVHNRREVRHYVVSQGNVQRIDPFALSPRDFADEWVRHSWTESYRLSDPASRATLRVWHEKWNGPDTSGEFIDTTMHCAQPDLWQVGLNFGNFVEVQTQLYFRIRWRPPFHFTMMSVSDHPWPDCTEEDPKADEARTLFPDQN